MNYLVQILIAVFSLISSSKKGNTKLIRVISHHNNSTFGTFPSINLNQAHASIKKVISKKVNSKLDEMSTGNNTPNSYKSGMSTSGSSTPSSYDDEKKQSNKTFSSLVKQSRSD